jgi:zinc and cadmium transporter
MLLSILLANALVSLGGLLGLFTLVIQRKTLQKMLLFLVSFSAGAMMGGAFLHLLPEASESLPADQLFPTVLFSFISFFAIEKILHWRHCHEPDCDVHTIGYMNLFGDAFHNLLDGLVIAAAFLTSPELGWVTTIAVAAHEIPQEISDFGVLLHAGWSTKKALIANYAVSSMAIFGGVLGYFLLDSVQGFQELLVPFAAGGFLYIAASDLLPELRREKNQLKAWISFGVFLLGVLFMKVLA